jgi:hypothetical protein
MRITGLAVIMLALAGCGVVNGGGEKAVLVDQCVKEGNDKKNCDCMAAEAENTLDKDVLAAMALGAQGKDAEADAAMQKLTMEQQFSVVTFAGSVLEKCNLL